jgi:hypothetical protein
VLEVAFRADRRERGTLFLDARRMRSLTRLVPASISITRREDPERPPVEALIEGAFARTYGSKIASHYPRLMSVNDADGKVLAAVGFRPAAEEALFLEQYLKQPVEFVLRRATGLFVSRSALVEIGSLASSGNGASIFLFVALAGYLRQHGFTHAVATATDSMQHAFDFFGFELIELAAADRAALSDGGASWGRYYAKNPKVVAGAIAASAARLERFLPPEHNGDLDRVFSRTLHSLKDIAV